MVHGPYDIKDCLKKLCEFESIKTNEFIQQWYNGVEWMMKWTPTVIK